MCSLGSGIFPQSRTHKLYKTIALVVLEGKEREGRGFEVKGKGEISHIWEEVRACGARERGGIHACSMAA